MGKVGIWIKIKNNGVTGCASFVCSLTSYLQPCPLRFPTCCQSLWLPTCSHVLYEFLLADRTLDLSGAGNIVSLLADKTLGPHLPTPHLIPLVFPIWTYVDVCGRMWTYVDVCGRPRVLAQDFFTSSHFCPDLPRAFSRRRISVQICTCFVFLMTSYLQPCPLRIPTCCQSLMTCPLRIPRPFSRR